MASLTHVCMWSEHGWERITAEEAARLHPGGTVSAHSGLFMCDLCGQYVTLTDGEIRTRYFRHSSSEKDKSCPERTFGPSYVPPTYVAGEHELPIRINLNHGGFQLELGLVSIPDELIDRNYRQSIIIKSGSGKEHVYSFERLAGGGITYLSVGKEPSERYYVVAPKDVSIYWPRETRGIPREGAIFDGSTRKLLMVDSDVKVNEKYYLLRQGNRDVSSYQGVQVKKICEQQVDWLKKWRVYEIRANELSEGAAKFFLDYGYRLTDKPVRLKPIWPIHIETPLVVKHNRNSMILHITGVRPVVPKSFPETTVSSHPCADKSRFVHVNCKARQQLISVGSAKVLQYFYYWRESLNFVQSLPSVEVLDSDGVVIKAGVNERLPKGAKLYVKTQFDGIVTLHRDGKVVDKQRLSVSQTPIAVSIAYGIKVQIRIGLDIVWVAEFACVGLRANNDNEDEELYQSLVRSSGKKVAFPHAWGALIKKHKNYPKTNQWIQQSVRNGFAPERAMKILEKHFADTRR